MSFTRTISSAFRRVHRVVTAFVRDIDTESRRRILFNLVGSMIGRLAARIPYGIPVLSLIFVTTITGCLCLMIHIEWRIRRDERDFLRVSDTSRVSVFLN